jgi:predicted enzyme related to lactoylglutathione lyase
VEHSSGGRALGPQHRHQARERRAEHHQRRRTRSLSDVWVAQPDSEHRQAERHRDRPETKARCQCRRTDAEGCDRHDGQHRNAREQMIDARRGHPRESSRTSTDERGATMATTEQLVTGVDFVPFSTQDLDKAVEFYGETLGLRRSVYIPERQYAEFETGNVTLSVVVGEAMGIGHRVNALALALHVDDVATARSSLEQRGVEFQGDILDTGVCHMAFFADPDGNALMLHHRYAPRT